jgi:hypothetical protein
VTKADKADFAYDWLDASQFGIGWLAGQTPRGTCDGKRRAWLVFGHSGSWPGATHLLMRSLRRTYSLSGVERIWPLSQLAALLSFLAYIS